MRGLPRQIALLGAAVFNVTLNALAGAGVLFGTVTGAVSDSVPTGITPAGWTFGVWSVIFAGVLVFALWLVRPTSQRPRYEGLAGPFILANGLTGLWQVPWLTRLFGVSAVVIVGILASLVWLYLRLDRMALRGAERWALGAPVALWLAWVAVATALNVTVALAATGWTPGGWGWPVAVVLGIGAVGAAVVRRTGDLAFAAVLWWAFAGIYAGQGGTPLTVALALAALVVAGALVEAKRAGRSFWPTAHVVA